MKDWKEFQNSTLNYPKFLEASNLSDSIDKVQNLIDNDLNDTNNNEILKSLKIDIGTVKKQLDLFYSALKKIAIDYEKGDLSQAMTKMKNLLFPQNRKNQFLCIEKFNQSKTYLYRIRTCENYQLYTREEMFHIPFTKRHLVGNQRYSINGFPCLYLGSSLYDCWEETRRPDLEKMNYSAFRCIRPLRLLKISQVQTIEDINNFKQLILFLLCSYPMNDDKKSFKFEYVFPELVLHSLISYNQNLNKKDYIDGIWYLSSRYYGKSFLYGNNYDIMMNLVLPVRKVEPQCEYCSELAKMFSISETTALFKDRIYGHVFVSNQIRPTKYQNSLFDLMEKELSQGRAHYRQIKID